MQHLKVWNLNYKLFQIYILVFFDLPFAIIRIDLENSKQFQYFKKPKLFWVSNYWGYLHLKISSKRHSEFSRNAKYLKSNLYITLSDFSASKIPKDVGQSYPTPTL